MSMLNDETKAEQDLPTRLTLELDAEIAAGLKRYLKTFGSESFEQAALAALRIGIFGSTDRDIKTGMLKPGTSGSAPYTQKPSNTDQ